MPPRPPWRPCSYAAVANLIVGSAGCREVPLEADRLDPLIHSVVLWDIHQPAVDCRYNPNQSASEEDEAGYRAGTLQGVCRQPPDWGRMLP